MKANHDHSFPNVSLLESDPSTYFEKLLQQLNELEDWVGNRDDEVLSMPEHRWQGAKR